MIDTHCHITSEYFDEIDKIIEKIKSVGVKKIIVNGCDMKSNLEVLELVKRYDIVYGAIGFHPTELDNNDLEWLEEHIKDEKLVALGEIGMDYHYENTNKELQINMFRKQLEIAEKYKKTVIVHSRDALQDTYDILKNYNVRGSLHCYSGSLEMAREFIKLGFYIGVGGVVTFRNAKNIINVIESISIHKILLETDAPYLTPEPYRGMKNDSSYIPLIVNKIASIKDITVDEVGDNTTRNANDLFDL